MKLDTVLPYLPTPIAGAITSAQSKWNKEEINQNYFRRLIDGVLAAAGYYLACKHASCVGLDPTKVALLGAVTLPGVTKLSIGGHFVYQGITQAIAAQAKGDWTSVAKSAALATFAYFATTQKYSQIVQAGYAKIGA
ncbi:MAG: hypothetical protein KBA81_07250 [Rhabdochlamydiaceae bacterium]|nr:hypothetical protein [Rhabdochlamydiaceae bacterium]